MRTLTCPLDTEPVASPVSAGSTTTETKYFYLIGVQHRVKTEAFVCVTAQPRISLALRYHATVTSGEGGYDPGHLLLDKTSTLTKKQTDAFLATVKESNLWTLSTIQKQQGFDGAQWVIELAKDRDYHVVDRWSPKDGPVRTTAMMMVHTLGKFHVPGPTY